VSVQIRLVSDGCIFQVMFCISPFPVTLAFVEHR